MNNQAKAERKNLDTKGNLSAFQVPDSSDKGNIDRCLFCGAIIPEGRWICPTCQEHYGCEHSEIKPLSINASDKRL